MVESGAEPRGNVMPTEEIVAPRPLELSVSWNEIRYATPTETLEALATTDEITTEAAADGGAFGERSEDEHAAPNEHRTAARKRGCIFRPDVRRARAQQSRADDGHQPFFGALDRRYEQAPVAS